MNQEPQFSLKDRVNTISLFLKERLSQLSAAGNSQFQKYYKKLLDAIYSYQEIIVLDEKGMILTWNNKFERLEGYKETEIIGQSFDLFYLPDDRQHQVPEQLLQTAGIVGKSRYFGQFVRKGGSTFWGNIILTAIKRDDQEVLGYIVLCREANR